MSLVHVPPEFRSEFQIDAAGRVTASRRAVARLCGVSDSAIRSLVSRVKGANLGGSKALESIADQNFDTEALDLRSAACLLAYYAFEAGRYKSEVAAKNLMKIPAEYHPRLSMSTPSKPSGEGVEKLAQKRLSRSLGGKMEVITPVGRIDILTSTEIIEVKVAQSWKSAMGQIIAYSYFYPSHQKRIHLYGSAHSDSKEYIEKICNAYGVIVTWE